LILIRLAALALSSIFFLGVTATALAGFLVLTGAPKPCIDRAMTPAPPPNEALQANWENVAERVGAGEAVALSVTEEQATMLATEHLRDKDVPITDLRIVFCPDGTTEAVGKVMVAGLNSDVLVKGYLDVEGEQPTVEVESIRAGNLPNFVAQGLLDLLWEGEEARTLPVSLNILSIEVNSGEAIVVVAP
jgi:hypothetical protein